MSPRILKIVRYVAAGTSAACVNLGVLFGLVHFLGVYYLAASVLSFLASIVAGFLLQKFWAFKGQGTLAAHAQLARYCAVTTVNLCINTGLMYLFVSVLGIWYLAAQILSGVAIAVTGYFGYQKFVFKPASSPR